MYPNLAEYDTVPLNEEQQKEHCMPLRQPRPPQRRQPAKISTTARFTRPLSTVRVEFSEFATTAICGFHIGTERWTAGATHLALFLAMLMIIVEGYLFAPFAFVFGVAVLIFWLRNAAGMRVCAVVVYTLLIPLSLLAFLIVFTLAAPTTVSHETKQFFHIDDGVKASVGLLSCALLALLLLGVGAVMMRCSRLFQCEKVARQIRRGAELYGF